MIRNSFLDVRSPLFCVCTWAVRVARANGSRLSYCLVRAHLFHFYRKYSTFPASIRYELAPEACTRSLHQSDRLFWLEKIYRVTSCHIGSTVTHHRTQMNALCLY